jgi:DnaA family protein
MGKSATLLNEQLALAVQLNDEATLNDFHWGKNTLLKIHIKTLLDTASSERWLYCFGANGVGKSHLLQACCQAYTHAYYLPLRILMPMGPHILEGIEETHLLCIDDLDVVAGDLAWEEALFHLYNRIRDNGEGKLLVSNAVSPTLSHIQLPDLKSRLAWGLSFSIEPLDDADKVTTLIHHAQKRGFNLPEPVGYYLVNRCTRNMQDLHQLLNQLDTASLSAKRRLTIPFVKQVLAL